MILMISALSVIEFLEKILQDSESHSLVKIKFGCNAENHNSTSSSISTLKGLRTQNVNKDSQEDKIRLLNTNLPLAMIPCDGIG